MFDRNRGSSRLYRNACGFRSVTKPSLRSAIKTPMVLPVFLILAACATPVQTYTAPQISDTGASMVTAAPLASDELAGLAVLGNPDLNAMRARAGLAEAQIFAAGLLPDPSLSLGVDAPLNGTNEVLAIAGSLGLDLAGLSTRPARLEAAKANAASVRQDIVWAEWLTRQNAKLLACRISWLEEVRQKTIQYRQVADQDLDRTLRAAGRGDIAAVEVDARRLSAADAADRDRTAESQLAAARLDLNRLLGVSPSLTILVEKPPAFSADLPAMPDLFARALELRADLKGLRDGLSAASAGVAVADASRFPLPSIAINAGRDTGNIRTLGPAVTFTLPVWNQARGDIAVAEADLSVLEAQYQARAETVRADIGSAVSAFEIARRQRADVIRDLSGIADQAARTEAAAARGDIAETSAAATRLAALDKEILADTLALSAAEASIALETALGQPLDTNK